MSGRIIVIHAVALTLGGWFQTAPAVPPAVRQVAPATSVSDALFARLPADYRDLARRFVTFTASQQKSLPAGTDEAILLVVVRELVRHAEADEFLSTHARADPSPIVRNAIVQVIGADARWLARPETTWLLESAVTGDSAATVSLTALEALRRWRMRELNVLLNTRLAAAAPGTDKTDVQKLIDEQARWLSLERGTTLPAFLREPPPVFRVLAATSPVRALMFGDFGTGSDAQKALAATLISYQAKAPFNFGLTLGDNFYSSGMESPADPRWKTQWEAMYGPLGIPFYPALGNHDWVGVDSPAAEILYSQKSSTWRMPASYYTFTAGPAQFFAIDTNNIAVSSKQQAWLDEALTKSTARWKIVYGHHPIYSGGNYPDSPTLIAKLLPLLANRADAYFCGHDHNLQVLRPKQGVRFFVAGGGGAGLYDLREYDNSLFASRSNGFAVVDATSSQLIISLVETSGKVVYTETLRKP